MFDCLYVFFGYVLRVFFDNKILKHYIINVNIENVKISFKSEFIILSLFVKIKNSDFSLFPLRVFSISCLFQN